MLQTRSGLSQLVLILLGLRLEGPFEFSVALPQAFKVLIKVTACAETAVVARFGR